MKTKRSIGTTISVGFGIVLLLHVSIALLNHVGLDRARSEFAQYSEHSANALRTVEIERKIAEMQRLVLAYAHSGHESSAQRMRETRGVLAKQIETGLQRAQSEADRRVLEQMAAHVETYSSLFESMTEDRRRGDHLTGVVMRSASERMLSALSAIAASEDAVDDVTIETAAQAARGHFLAAVTAATQYRLAPNSKFVRDAKTSVAALERSLVLTGPNLSEAVERDVERAVRAAAEFEAGFLEMVQVTRSYLHLVNVVMAGEAAEASRFSDEFKKASLAAVELHGAEIVDGQKVFQVISDIVSLLTILFGVVAAWLIKRKTIPPILEMTDTMARLTKGDFECEISGADRDDEIGQMAQAARVFQEQSQFNTTVLENSQRLTRQVAGANQRLRDEVAERRIAEADLRATAEDLKRTNAELEQFAFVASHDLQEPLRKITSFVQLLEEHLGEACDEEGQRFMGFVTDGTARMRALIQDLLHYARAGSRAMDRREVPAAAVVAEAVEDLQCVIDENQAIIEVEGELPTIVVDRSQFSQVIHNLISNAIKYRSEARPHIRIAGQERDREWEFSVSDNGMGFEAEFSERIFVLFQRLHAKHEHSGTGIGLAICKKIVVQHGGDIRAESEPGVGSVFRFTIAKAAPGVIDPMPAPDRPPIAQLEPVDA